MKNKKIAVVFGGPSTEAEVSARTAEAAYQSLIRQNFNAEKIEFSRNIASDLQNRKIDVVFNAMHGAYGEDGALQGLLEVLRIPYTHSGVRASALGISKPLTKEIVKNHGVNVARDIIVKGSQVKTQNEIKIPLVIKPVDDGSSVGVYIIKTLADLDNVKTENEKEYLIEEFIEGRELSVAVLDDVALGTVEIQPKNGFYDYKNKYTKGATEYICPAPVPQNIEDTALEYARLAHVLLGCKGVTRSDIIYNERSGKLYFLEINTHPGMTETSLVPKIAKSKNIDFDELVLRILLSAKTEL